MRRPASRPRNAARSRELLLAAARELFADRGFDRTTLRDVGERAGVDAALVARYFGSKTGLYLAALPGDGPPADLLDPDRLAGLLERVRRSPGPVFQAAVRAHDDPQVQSATVAELESRLVAPLRDRFDREHADRPGLRAELAVAAFAGIALGRTSGAFPDLAGAAAQDVRELTAAVLSALLPGRSDRTGC